MFLDNQIVTASKRIRKRTGRYYKSGCEKARPRRTPGFLAKKKKKKKKYIYIYTYIYTHTYTHTHTHTHIIMSYENQLLYLLY